MKLTDDVVCESAENQNLCEETPETEHKDTNEKTLGYDVSVPSANVVMETMRDIEYGADVVNFALSDVALDHNGLSLSRTESRSDVSNKYQYYKECHAICIRSC